MRNLVLFTFLFSMVAVSSADAVVVNYGRDRYIICLTQHESSAIFRNPDIASNYADIAARQALREVVQIITTCITGIMNAMMNARVYG